MEKMGAQFRKPRGMTGKWLGRLMNVQHISLTRWVIELLDIKPTDSVLDIGCGGGMAIKRLSRIVDKGPIAGIDHSEVMVRESLRNNKVGLRSGKVKIQQGCATKIPYEDESFDKVIAIESFYFWPDPSAGLKEVYRVLKPCGTAAIAFEVHKEGDRLEKNMAISEQMKFPIYSGEEMVGMLKQAGFSQAIFDYKPYKGSQSWLNVIGGK
jgi:ubiquinone/menaquinone biosynthesis C-methylase UbiE